MEKNPLIADWTGPGTPDSLCPPLVGPGVWPFSHFPTNSKKSNRNLYTLLACCDSHVHSILFLCFCLLACLKGLTHTHTLSLAAILLMVEVDASIPETIFPPYQRLFSSDYRVFKNSLVIVFLLAYIRNANISEGNDVSVECRPDSSPEVSAVSWSRDGAPLSNDSGRVILLENNTKLVILRSSEFLLCFHQLCEDVYIHRYSYIGWCARDRVRERDRKLLVFTSSNACYFSWSCS